VHHLVMLAGSLGLITASAALWGQKRRIDRRLFAGLISIGVTSSLFSVLAWAATAIARIAPLPLTWLFVAMFALLFALRLYRELQMPPPREPG
jgi:hypothetical protein